MTDEQAPQSVPDVESLGPEQAQSEIDRLSGDAEFQSVYLSRNADPARHKEAVSRMTRLFELAHPPEPPPGLARLPEQGEQPEDEEPVSELSEAEQVEAQIAETKEVLQNRFGAEWEAELPGIRGAIKEIGGDRGDELLAHLSNNYGNDPDVLSQLMEMWRENERYPLVAALAELADANTTQEGARLQLERLSADADFFRRYTDAGRPGHAEALALMRALHIVASPPEFLTEQEEFE